MVVLWQKRGRSLENKRDCHSSVIVVYQLNTKIRKRNLKVKKFLTDKKIATRICSLLTEFTI